MGSMWLLWFCNRNETAFLCLLSHTHVKKKKEQLLFEGRVIIGHQRLGTYQAGRCVPAVQPALWGKQWTNRDLSVGDWEWELIMLAYFHCPQICRIQESKQVHSCIHALLPPPPWMYALTLSVHHCMYLSSNSEHARCEVCEAVIFLSAESPLRFIQWNGIRRWMEPVSLSLHQV